MIQRPALSNLLNTLAAHEPTAAFVHQAEFSKEPNAIRKIGVFSSSFNPPTKAHMHICAQACL
jgi:hypothetical protein